MPRLLPWWAEAGQALLPPAWDLGTLGCRALLGGRFLAGAIAHPPAALPGVQQPFRPLARAVVQTVSKLLSNTAVIGTNGKPY